MKTYYPEIPSPCYVLEEEKLVKNLVLLRRVQDEADVKIICALKGFSFWQSFPLVGQYLAGATASSLWEARLASEEMKKEVHVYAPAYIPHEFDEILRLAHHISFNSTSEWLRYKEKTLAAGVSAGLRVNPEKSTVDTDLYNPCMPGSRLGSTLNEFQKLTPSEIEGLEGLHFHALCEQDCDALEAVLFAFEEKFCDYLPQMKWVNFGGGHHITRADYHVEALIHLLKEFKLRYPHLEVILEPGEAVGWQTGFLLSTVLDVIENDGPSLILDVSFSAHMPDCLEMPYRPEVRDAGVKGEKQHDARIGGGTCLSGDFLDDFSFDQIPKAGDQLIFEDMIHYTMVKTTFFNGVQHPAIGLLKKNGDFKILRRFEFVDYRSRLG